MVILYDAGREKWQFLCRTFSGGTLFPLVLGSPLFWILIFIELAIINLERDQALPALDWKATGSALSLLTFFLVFYSSNCYARYFQLHGLAVGINGLSLEWTILVHNHFGHLGPEFEWNLCRLYFAAMHLHYAVLGGETGKNGNKGISESEWNAMQKGGYLKPQEVAQLKAFPAFKPFVPLAWALLDVKSALCAGSSTSTTSDATAGSPQGKAAASRASRNSILTTVVQLNIFGSFERTAFGFRGQSGQTHALMAQPVPYPYFHALKLMLLIALVILGYGLAELESGPMAFSIFTVVIAIMVGLQEVAVAMSDPFGDDAVDLDTKGYLESAEKNARAYLDILKLGHDAPPKHSKIASDRTLPAISAKADGAKPPSPKRAPSQARLSTTPA